MKLKSNISSKYGNLEKSVKILKYNYDIIKYQKYPLNVKIKVVKKFKYLDEVIWKNELDKIRLENQVQKKEMDFQSTKKHYNNNKLKFLTMKNLDIFSRFSNRLYITETLA